MPVNYTNDIILCKFNGLDDTKGSALYRLSPENLWCHPPVIRQHDNYTYIFWRAHPANQEGFLSAQLWTVRLSNNQIIP